MSEGLPFNHDRKGDPARHLLRASRERSRNAAIDLFLGNEGRLTEWQRAAGTALFRQLIEGVEAALRAALAADLAERPSLEASLSAPHVAIALPILAHGRGLRHPGFTAFVLRRLEEHRIYRAAGTAAGALLQALVRDPDEEIARAAMRLLIAQSRRFDLHLEPSLAAVELQAELQHRLIWTVAAALRSYITREHDLAAPAADQLVSAAAAGLIAAYDEGERIEAHAGRLVALLAERGRVDAALAARLLGEGSLPLFLAILARLSGLTTEAAWEVLFDPLRLGPAIILKAAAFPRGSAAAALLAFAGPEAAAEQLDLFDRVRPNEAEEAVRLWRVDPGYRAAIARLERRAA